MLCTHCIRINTKDLESEVRYAKNYKRLVFVISRVLPNDPVCLTCT